MTIINDYKKDKIITRDINTVTFDAMLSIMPSDVYQNEYYIELSITRLDWLKLTDPIAPYEIQMALPNMSLEDVVKATEKSIEDILHNAGIVVEEEDGRLTETLTYHTLDNEAFEMSVCSDAESGNWYIETNEKSYEIIPGRPNSKTSYTVNITDSHKTKEIVVKRK